VPGATGMYLLQNGCIGISAACAAALLVAHSGSGSGIVENSLPVRGPRDWGAVGQSFLLSKVDQNYSPTISSAHCTLLLVRR
jgi:hypothetical protein